MRVQCALKLMRVLEAKYASSQVNKILLLLTTIVILMIYISDFLCSQLPLFPCDQNVTIYLRIALLTGLIDKLTTKEHYTELSLNFNRIISPFDVR